MQLKTIVERKNGQSLRYKTGISTSRILLLNELRQLAQLEKMAGEPSALEYGFTIKIT